jgi:hypothetical protein
MLVELYTNNKTINDVFIYFDIKSGFVKWMTHLF